MHVGTSDRVRGASTGLEPSLGYDRSRINVGYAETAAGAVDHDPCSDRRKQCTGGYTHLCAVRASHKLCIDAARPRSSRGVQASAWPAGGLRCGLA
eukprot:scaffold25990_cov36-Phaeocystis_antarctica.AAC.2